MRRREKRDRSCSAEVAIIRAKRQIYLYKDHVGGGGAGAGRQDSDVSTEVLESPEADIWGKRIKEEEEEEEEKKTVARAMQECVLPLSG